MNVRGLNDPKKHKPFASWLPSHCPLFGAILESHIKEPSLNLLMSSICPGWNFCSNHAEDPDSRIILIWKHPMQVSVLNRTSQSITCELSLPNSQPIYYTAVYASNQSEDRTDLWADLLCLHSTLDLDSKPWLLGGDFNQIIYPSEHSRPEVNAPDSLMYQLQDCFMQLGVFNLRYLGPQHTLTNNQPADPIAKKLDRLLVNSPLIANLPQALATYLPPIISDHTPCLIDLNYKLPQAGTQPYKFQNYLTKHPSFAQCVYDAWLRAGSECTTLTQLCWKLKVIKRDLKQLNRENYSKIQERVSETYSLLQHVQVQALQDPTPESFQAERDLHQRWLFLREIEESYFRQKSRINWLAEGDFNTTYFHRICQTRESYNAIRAFLSASGVWITDPIMMSLHAVAHFASVLGPRFYTPPQLCSAHAWFSDMSLFHVSQNQAQQMIALPTPEEIKRLFFKLNPNKAPGPDELTSGFFKASWDILGSEVTQQSLTSSQVTSFLQLLTQQFCQWSLNFQERVKLQILDLFLV